jgi:hypothetical protein
MTCVTHRAHQVRDTLPSAGGVERGRAAVPSRPAGVVRRECHRGRRTVRSLTSGGASVAEPIPRPWPGRPVGPDRPRGLSAGVQVGECGAGFVAHPKDGVSGTCAGQRVCVGGVGGSGGFEPASRGREFQRCFGVVQGVDVVACLRRVGSFGPGCTRSSPGRLRSATTPTRDRSSAAPCGSHPRRGATNWRTPRTAPGGRGERAGRRRLPRRGVAR